jgi:hypothetical protein
MGLFSGKKVTKAEVAKTTAERQSTLRQGKKGRPLAPSGTVHTARWRYGKQRKGGNS